MLTVCHLSDTQIRNFQRHQEFRESYEHLYKSLREQKPDVIVLVGDIAHAKTHISPEFVDLCSEYFTELAKIAPLIVVPGNHDGNLSNPGRLDALTPIIKALDNPQIRYYKDSGIYRINLPLGGPMFDVTVFSCFDEDWPTEGSKSGLINIGLYHGMVKGALLQNGQVVEDCPYTLKQFLEIVDYLMMGDIHRVQILDHGYRAAYCGSFPQQSFGESTQKGYLLWKIESRDKHEVDFIKLPNVCPFYTITVPDSLEVAGNLPIQPDSKVRVFSRQLSSIEEAELRRKLEAMYQPKELFFKDDVNAHRRELQVNQGATIEDLVDVGVQERLIRDFLEPYSLDESVINKVLELNRNYDSGVRKEESVLRNVQYNFGKMWWSNVGPYGEDNEFDWSKHKGVVGIFGKNATGKSTLAVDIPLYTIFNTNSKRVVKNDHLINDKRESCESGIEIGVGKKTYKIERNTSVYVKSGKRRGKPVYQGKTDVSFRVYDENGEQIEDKQGLERGDTDKQIRQVFGIADDFMATSVAPQWRLLDFIEKRGTERQKILGRYFDIDAFYKKYELANNDSKEVKAEIRFLEKRELDKQLESRREVLARLNEDKGRVEKEISLIEESAEVIRKQVGDIKKRLVNVSSERDEEKLLSVLETTDVYIEEKKRSIKQIIEEKKELEKEAQKILPLIQRDIKDLEKKRKKALKKRDEISGCRADLASLDTTIQMLEASIQKFKQCDCEHEPGCPLVEELDGLKAERLKAKRRRAPLLKKIERYDELCTEIDKLDDEITDLGVNKKDFVTAEDGIKDCLRLLDAETELLKKTEVEREDLQDAISKVEEDKQQREKNKELEESIEDLSGSLADLEEKISDAQDRLSELLRGVSTEELAIDALIKDLQHLAQLKEDYTAYEFFLKAMGKEGLPRIIVHNNLSAVNAEISKILSGKVGFDIDLETSESGKEIEVIFRHDKSKPRRIEVCSGMEKTITSIVLRAALVNVTTLPRPNIYVLDEAFSSLDAEYIDAVGQILQYLKTLFSSVVIITHLDGFKDLVDHAVLIERDEHGFARLLDDVA